MEAPGRRSGRPVVGHGGHSTNPITARVQRAVRTPTAWRLLPGTVRVRHRHDVPVLLTCLQARVMTTRRVGRQAGDGLPYAVGHPEASHPIAALEAGIVGPGEIDAVRVHDGGDDICRRLCPTGAEDV